MSNGILSSKLSVNLLENAPQAITILSKWKLCDSDLTIGFSFSNLIFSIFDFKKFPPFLTKRSNNFRSDPKIISGSAKLSDYRKSGYDRGHLAPAGDMKSSQHAMSESFFMSNMSPQLPSFNRGGWKKLESLVRFWAKDSEIHIVTAGILNKSLSKIGESGVSVPDYFYKIIFDTYECKMIGFVMPNKKITLELESYVKTIDEIEKLTGIDFFYNLEDHIEDELESSVNIDSWTFKK